MFKFFGIVPFFTMFKILTSRSVPMGWTPQQSGGLVARGWEAKLAQGQRGLGTKTRAAPTQPGLAAFLGRPERVSRICQGNTNLT